MFRGPTGICHVTDSSYARQRDARNQLIQDGYLFRMSVGQGRLPWAGRSMDLCGRREPRHELVDARLRPSVDEAGQQVGDVNLWIDLIQLAGLDE